MALTYLIILALVQGITEFLPVSSSGHLVLIHDFWGTGEAARWNEDLSLDIAVHIGTLLAALVYFRDDIFQMLLGVFKPKAVQSAQGRRMILLIIIGSLPVILAGFALFLWEPVWLRSFPVMAWATIIFGIILWAADHYKPNERALESIGYKEALFIGLAQILALIPGTSRSGITMTAGRFLGFTRTDCARYSLLLAIVAISGAGTLIGLDLWQNGNVALGPDILIATVLSFIAGYIAIHLMMVWLSRASFAPFAIYRVALGAGLLGLYYGGVIS